MPTKHLRARANQAFTRASGTKQRYRVLAEQSDAMYPAERVLLLQAAQSDAMYPAEHSDAITCQRSKARQCTCRVSGAQASLVMLITHKTGLDPRGGIG